MHHIDEILIQLGLSENETKVFVANLQLGPTSISRVARKAGVARTYVYELVDELKEKGLVAEIEEHGVKKVQTLDYGGLLAYVSRKQKDLERLERDLVKSVDAFRAMSPGVSEKTRVRFFEGVEGIKSINDEIRTDLEHLKQPYNFYVVFSADRMEAVIPGWIEHNQHIYFEPWMRKYAIISETPLLSGFLHQVNQHKQKNFLHKLWPTQNKEFPTDTLCWKNKIAYLDMQQYPSGIIVENESIAQTFVMWFEQMWGSL